jgi:hypothetical protein
MKKLLVFVVAVALVVWVVSWFRNEGAVATSAARPWPGKMGGLDSAARRVQPLKANQSSVKLAGLAKALPKSDVVDEYVAREIARAELTIGKAPALPDVSAMRELLLRETMVWDQFEEIGSVESTARRTMHMTVARALVANALAKARGNDPAAWEDLHAVWNLARSLRGHPQMMTQTAAFSMARMINAVGWKMPLPAPAWFAELQSHDSVPPLLEAFQHQTASYWQDGAQLFPTAWLARDVDHDRQIAEELVGTTKCDVNMRMNKLGTDLSFIWRRAFRYRAEREATANAIRMREGKPIEPKSVCSDGAWTVEGTTLRFSREIATAAPDRPMPLVLRVK